LGRGAHALPPSHRGSMMSCMGFSETIFLFFLALLIFGPKKLPEIARQVGKVLNEVKRASNEFKAQITSEVSQLDMENQRQILPPSEPPKGAVAALPLAPEPASTSLETSPEDRVEPGSGPHSLAKAPDA
jgi:Tat protein translocase TatB subunit